MARQKLNYCRLPDPPLLSLLSTFMVGSDAGSGMTWRVGFPVQNTIKKARNTNDSILYISYLLYITASNHLLTFIKSFPTCLSTLHKP